MSCDSLPPLRCCGARDWLCCVRWETSCGDYDRCIIGATAVGLRIVSILKAFSFLGAWGDVTKFLNLSRSFVTTVVVVVVVVVVRASLSRRHRHGHWLCWM